MLVNYYKSDLGIIAHDTEIRLKSSYTRKILTPEEFEACNPIKIKKSVYLRELNTYFNNSSYTWEYHGVKYRKLDHFEISNFGELLNYKVKDIPTHKLKCYPGTGFVVIYHNRLYYTFIAGNYYPQMQLLDFNTHKYTGKWTNIRNLAPVLNENTKSII